MSSSSTLDASRPVSSTEAESVVRSAAVGVRVGSGVGSGLGSGVVGSGLGSGVVVGKGLGSGVGSAVGFGKQSSASSCSLASDPSSAIVPPPGHELQTEVTEPASAYVSSGHTAVQSEEEELQYDWQPSYDTGLLHVPLGMYTPPSLQLAEQVRVPPFLRMLSP